MNLFVDTSALLAVIDQDDLNHARAAIAWQHFSQPDVVLWTTNYVVLETTALVQRRISLSAAKVFVEDMLPVLQIEWVHQSVHQEGLQILFAADRRNLSLVDCISFVTMRRHGMVQAFAFDKHFVEQGFTCLP